MNIDKYTNKLKSIIQNAQSSAVINSNQFITNWHLLLVMLEDSDNLIPKIIDTTNGNSNLILNEIHREIDLLPKISGSGYNEPRLSPEVIKSFATAEKIADKNKDSFVNIAIILSLPKLLLLIKIKTYLIIQNYKFLWN